MTDQMTPRERMMIGHQTAGDRLLASQKLQTGSLYLHGEPPPTRNQISAVLHALGDHSLQAHMNSETVLTLGDDRAHLGGTWRADTAHGRFFQMMGDWAADWPDLTEKARAKAAAAERVERGRAALDRYRNGDTIDQSDTDEMADLIEHLLRDETSA